MHAVGPLLAAGIDWLEGLLPVLFVLFWIISQVVNLVRRVAGDGGRAAPPPAPAARRPVAGEPPADVRVELERQIEEFLRQARGGEKPPAARPAQAQRPTEPRPSASRPPPPRPTAPRVERPRVTGSATGRRPPPSKPAPPTPRISDRHLTPLGDAGDDIAEHVHDAFDQSLGRRDAAASPSAGPPQAAQAGGVAGDLVAALRDPVALRRLIVMREILDRPVERWE